MTTRWCSLLWPDDAKLCSLSGWVKHYPSTLSLLSLILSANTADSFLFSTIGVVGISTAVLSCSLVLLDTEEDGWDGVTRKSGVRFSFTTRLLTGFLDTAILNVIWHGVPLSALCLPQGAWELLGTDAHVVETVSEAALCSVKLSLLGRLRVTAEREALQGATFNAAEFLTLIWVLVEGPENLIGLGLALHSK